MQSGPWTRTKYAYDAAGHTLADGSRSFTFNDAGQMTSATTANGTTTYLYNAIGQRIQKVTPSSVVNFAYDEAGHLIGEYDGMGNLIQEVIWLGDTPIATVRLEVCGFSIFYIHTDHLNTPRRITRRSTTDVVWSWESDPFGATGANENPSGLGAFPFNLRFPGQYYDAETGVNYNMARDYDPATGRYVESDGIGMIGQIRAAKKAVRLARAISLGDASESTSPFSFTPNLYSYGDDDPLSNIDPRGEFGLQGAVAVGVGVVAGLVIYAIYKCVKKCDDPNVCPFPRDSGDPVVDQERNAWVTKCKQKCAGSFGELAKLGPW